MSPLTQARFHPKYRIHRLLNWLANALLHDRPINELLIGVFWVLALALPAFLTLVEFADPQEQEIPKPLTHLVESIHAHRLVIALCLMIMQIGLGTSIGLLVRIQAFDRDKVREILEAAVAHHFREQNRAEFHYRATLFKLRSLWFLGEWLGIVCRSGENYQRSNTIFSVDRMRKAQTTGICGECFRQNASLVVAIPADSTDYAMQGYVAECELSSINVKSTVFFATPIRQQTGRLWGVLVLDTTDPKQIPGPRNKTRAEDDLGHWALAIKTAIRGSAWRLISG